MLSFLSCVKLTNATCPWTEQPEAYRKLSEGAEGEEWNVSFSGDGLYSAFTQSSLLTSLYSANVEAVQEQIKGLETVRVLEVGGGNGALWQRIDWAGIDVHFTLVDPVAETHEKVASVLPEGSTFTGVEGRAENVELSGEFDLVVLSLTIHHIPGLSRAHNAKHGIESDGKKEVLEKVRAHLAPGGLVLINEADVHCEIDLASGSHELEQQIIGSYVRRCAMALVADVEEAIGCRVEDADGDACLEALEKEQNSLVQRWATIVQLWCVGQLRVAEAPVSERDVFELDVGRWLALFEECGFLVEKHDYTDVWALFVQYQLRVE